MDWNKIKEAMFSTTNTEKEMEEMEKQNNNRSEILEQILADRNNSRPQSRIVTNENRSAVLADLLASSKKRREERKA